MGFFEKIKAKGIEIGKVTLHVGLGTFRPVKEEDISLHLEVLPYLQ